jgi:cytochrome oxidase Cu insertion factor (SCO1/SenC/PrrC family)
MTKITTTHRRLRIILWTTAIAAVVVVAGFAVMRPGHIPSHQAVYRGDADIRSEFALIDHDEQAVTQDDYKGRWQLVFFGFTNCPDICPTTLAYMGSVLDKLGSEANQVAPLFVTVDPERDTPEVLKDYVANFHPQLTGLTGSTAQVSAAADAFKVYHEKLSNETAPDGYMMAHAGHIYLMAPDGRFDAVFLESAQPVEEMAAQISMRIAKEKRNH